MAIPADATFIELVFKYFGPYGLILILWYMDNRRILSILAGYKADMDETRQMYKANVSLVDDYNSVAKSLHEVVVANTSAMQAMYDMCTTHQFCPAVRVEKKTIRSVERTADERDR